MSSPLAKLYMSRRIYSLLAVAYHSSAIDKRQDFKEESIFSYCYKPECKKQYTNNSFKRTPKSHSPAP